MNTASLDLCKELSELSGWAGLEDLPKTWDMQLDYWMGGTPQYTLSYLLRKLPQNSWVGYVDTSGRRGYALAKTYAWNSQGTDIDKIAECRADTPEDAACMLAIELFKQGVQPGQAPPQGGKQ